ncbi:hypothetical protein M5689_010989 [Euphorbia peplus]|nr:hypothetical protein M5689_010989 [Euphorbia peplus]
MFLASRKVMSNMTYILLFLKHITNRILIRWITDLIDSYSGYTPADEHPLSRVAPDIRVMFLQRITTRVLLDSIWARQYLGPT